MSTHTRETITEKIRKITCASSGAIPENVNNDTSFNEDLRVDSLDQIEIVMQIEDEFDIEIPDEDVENIKTVGQAIEYVFGKVDA